MPALSTPLARMDTMLKTIMKTLYTQASIQHHPMKSPLAVTLALIIFFIPLAASQETGMPGANFATALQLTPGEYVFSLDAGTLHYFRVDLKKGETLLVVLRMPTSQDFDIYLLDPFRQVVDQGIRTAGLTERLGYLAVEDGPHYLVVLGFGGSSGTYTLSISISKPITRTETVTTTMATKILEVETRLSVVTQTVTSERIVTATITTTRDVERLPWTLLGLSILGLSVLATGLSLGGALEKLARSGEGEKKTPPALVAEEKSTLEKIQNASADVMKKDEGGPVST
jgi:hypothetical protein